ncbi:unnamed protein product [Vicia faba]|uniref:Uncharacterized protein n=1 Tax=Vicia faba TaxID=3906 RepID=A0AAV0YKV6_VICFA|nr:unnamed protein product [Vicia faba]
MHEVFSNTSFVFSHASCALPSTPHVIHDLLYVTSSYLIDLCTLKIYTCLVLAFCYRDCLELGFDLLYLCSGGLSFLQFCNLDSFRTKFVLGFSIFLGLSIPQYFNEYTSINGFGPVDTGARWFNDMVNVSFQSKTFRLRQRFYREKEGKLILVLFQS